MDNIEVSGRTIEEAVETAARELGVRIEAVEYEIVEEGTKGFLGLGQTPALIKASVKEGVERGTPPSAREEEQEKMPSLESVGDSVFTDSVMQILGDVVEAMNLDIKPVLKSDGGEEVLVELVGKDAETLVGKRGQTLDALQYLVGIGANKSGLSRKRITLDAQGFRENHLKLLEQRARDYASAVKEQGQEAVLEPQPARDRRIIHMVLADDPDVYTYSEGMGDDRHVVISPKK